MENIISKNPTKSFIKMLMLTCFMLFFHNGNAICHLENTNFTTSVNGSSVTITLSGTGYNSYLVGWSDGTYNSTLTHTYTTTGTKTICVRFKDSTANGYCDTTICKTVTITTVPFTCPIQGIGFTSQVTGNTVTLTKTGTGFSNYTWTYGDGTTGTSTTHTYTSAGVKEICIKYQYVDSTNTAHHCDTTICHTITIANNLPFVCQLQSVNFTTHVTGDTVRLTLSGGGYTSYIIGYGDGTYSTSNTHVYSSTGVKTICVKFKDSTSLGSCDTTICKTVGITAQPFTCPLQNTNFTTSVNGNSVTITLSGTGYNSYLVGWSDGIYNTSLTHTYTTTGTKTICVRFKDSTATGYCDTTVCKTIAINNPICTWPNLFTSIWDSCTVSNHSLNGYSTLNTCYKYQWKVNGVLVGTTRMLTYPITQNGTYAVCLSITDTCTHCDTTICSTRTITCIPTTTSCNWQSHNPYVNFWDSCTATNKSLNGYVYFANSSTCFKYQWKVNGVAAGTTRPFTYPITQNGTYNVCLIVTDTCNHCDTTYCSTRTITCFNNWTCPIQGIGFTTQVTGNTVTITKTGSGYNNYLYNYGDGTTGTSSTHAYTIVGVKEICLKYQYIDSTNTAHHCDTTICHTVTITTVPFTCPIQGIGFTAQINGNTVTLTKTGSGFSNYTWTYGDGTSGTSNTHTYTTAGVKEICLKYSYVDSANTAHHCDTTICHSVTIANNFTCPLNNTNFTTNVNGNIVIVTLSGSGYNSYIVGWGDATYNSSTTNGGTISLTHQYTTAGVKTICVKYISSTTAGSCDTTICKNIEVTIPNFVCPIHQVGFTTQVNGNTVTITKTGSGYNNYSYNYGDGTSGTSNTHTYTAAGVKEICLKYLYADSANTALHCDTTICHTITIAPTFVCPLHSVNFTTSVNGNTVTISLVGGDYNSYLVGWSDGTYNTSLSHTYTTTGTKTICIKFKDSTSLGSCDTTICHTITLTNPAFNCPIHETGFTAQVTGNVVTLTKTGSGFSYYTWTYGDGTTGTSNTHTYTSAGVKEICIRYQYVDSTNTAHHCDTTICHTITIVNNLPFVCHLQNTNFTTSVSGNSVTIALSGTGYNSYLVGWSDGTYNSALTHTYTSTGTKTICVRFKDSTVNGYCDTTICKTITIASICDSITCVLPGDADHDLTVNNFDIFAIGLSYNRTGLTRPNATTQYTLQPSPDWSSTHYYGFNDKYADCNGDGVIKNSDASVILQNYIVKPFNHFNHRQNQDSLPPVFLAFDSLPIFQIGNPCNTTEIVSDINVGLPNQIANDVYGIGFSVDYPASFATDSCFKIQIDLDANSWFATNEPILYLFKNIPEFHRVDVGIARTNGIARSGNGRIGKIKFVVEDGIFLNGRTTSNKQYTFTVNNVDAINGYGVEIGLSGKSTTTNFVVSGIQNHKIDGLKIYPNPVKNYLNIDANEMLEDISVTDITGKVIYTEAVNSMNKTIDFSSLSKGMYMIEIHTKNAVSTAKIIKAE